MNSFSRLFDQDWSHFDNFGRIGSELDKFLSGFEAPRSDTRTPPINIAQNEQEVRVSVELPGVSAEQVDVTVRDRVLTITGKHGAVPAENNTEGDWLVRERTAEGPFERQVNLPWNVQADAIQATYTNGILQVTLPRGGSR